MRPYRIHDNAGPVPWEPTTLRQLGRDEAFLEHLVASDFRLLGLNPYETGVSGRVVAIRQASLSTPTGRDVRPDVVLLSESGHIVVVEAKLADNPELRDRRAIAQVVEYAASIANLTDEDAFQWLGHSEATTWLDSVQRWFPGVPSPDRLASALRARMRNAEIHLVIVTDGAPDGLRDLVRAVAGQAALGEFQLHVVELKPYTAQGLEEVLLVPTAIARTEIVARTAITISYEAGAEQPSVSVVASSPAEVEQAMADVRAGGPPAALAAVIGAYDAEAPADLRTRGRARFYRQIQPEGWPGGIHYEFMHRGHGQIGVDLHVEGRKLLAVSKALPAVLEHAKAVLPGAVHDPRWSNGMGRISVAMSAADPGAAAQTMTRLIAMTREHVDRLLGSRAMSEGE